MSETPVISQIAIDYLNTVGEPVTVENDQVCLRRSALRSSSSDSAYYDQVIKLPNILHSINALRWCGLKTQTSQIILDNWTTDHNADGGQSELPMRKFIHGQILYTAFDADPSQPDEDWEYALEMLGVNRELRDGIMDPAHRLARDFRSAKEWAIEFVVASWDFLVSCNTRIRDKRDWGNLAGMDGNEGAVGQWANGLPQPPPSIPPPAITSTPATLRTPGLLTRVEQTSESDPEFIPTAQVLRQQGRLKEGEMALFKGGFLHFLSRMTNSVAISRRKGLWTGAIVTSKDGDFNTTTKSALYLTQQWDTAYIYASYCARARPSLEVVIMQINVPLDIMPPEIQYHIEGEEWIQMVFECRTDMVNCPLPRRLYNVPILFGRICSYATALFYPSHTRDEAVIKSARDIKALYLASRHEYAIQFAFSGPELLENVSKRCVNKVTFHDIPGTSQ